MSANGWSARAAGAKKIADVPIRNRSRNGFMVSIFRRVGRVFEAHHEAPVVCMILVGLEDSAHPTRCCWSLSRGELITLDVEDGVSFRMSFAAVAHLPAMRQQPPFAHPVFRQVDLARVLLLVILDLEAQERLVLKRKVPLGGDAGMLAADHFGIDAEVR